MRLLGSAVASLILFLSLPPLAAQEDRSSGVLGGVRIFGTLRDAETNQGVENVLVKLRRFTGSTADSVFTNSNGDFTFNDVARGIYNLNIQHTGYQGIEQQISFTGSVVSLELKLHRIDRDGAVSGGASVSVRELSIPRKAHDAMQKGLKLLHIESDYERSLTQFQRAIKEYPDYYEAYAQMGMAHMNLGDTASSERMLRKSIALSDEQYVDAYYMLASLCTDGQRFAEAEPLARMAIELNANGWQGYFELARALYGLNNLADAQANATIAAELQPDHAQTYLVLANIHGRLHDYQELVNDLNAYLKLAPSEGPAEQVRETRDKVR